MANLSLTFQNIYDNVSWYLGLTAYGSSPTSTDLTRAKDICYRGLRRFYFPIEVETKAIHYWSFLRKEGIINTIIGKWQYNLPDDFVCLIAGPKFRAGENYANPEFKPQSHITANRSISITTALPKYYAVVQTLFDKETGHHRELWLDPAPKAVYNYYYTYVSVPDKPETSTDLLVGGVVAAETILQCCLAAAELQEKPEQLQQGQAGYQETKAQEMLQILIKNDKLLLPAEADPNLTGVVVLATPTAPAGVS